VFEIAASTTEAQMDREASPAYQALRPSAGRLLAYCERAIARQGGHGATIYIDMLEKIGSRRVTTPAMSELHCLGLIECVRSPKRFDCRLSSRWRDIASMQEALVVSARARAERLPVTTSRDDQRVITGAAV
jgi:hypothetical protein